MKSILSFSVSVVFLALLAYGAFHLFHIDAGQPIDWAIGLGAFLWLLIIVTIPWNAHFKAREILVRAYILKPKDTLLMEPGFRFARKVAQRSLWIAIGLHLCTALGLYQIASLGISPVGYSASVITVIATLVRPSIRFYEYLEKRLTSIHYEYRLPSEETRLRGRW